MMGAKMMILMTEVVFTGVMCNDASKFLQALDSFRVTLHPKAVRYLFNVEHFIFHIYRQHFRD